MNGTHRILAIDRAEEIARLGDVHLEALDAEVATATDGRAGLAAARLMRPDLILLGVGLPDVSGFEVLRQLRQDPVTRAVRVMFVTGSNDPDDKLRGFEMGAVDYVTKPYHPAELLARVRQALQTKSMLDELEVQACTDALTGLANRPALLHRLSGAIARAREDDAYRYAVLFLDFDRFKVINDSLGHEAGDLLLVGIANRLITAMPPGGVTRRDGAPPMAVRLGGDEFVVLLEGFIDDGQVLAVADRLQDVLSRPHAICDRQVTSTASIGIVIGHDQYDCADAVLRDADTAMYRAKCTGRARHELFDEAMHDDAMERLDLESALRQAVRDEQFSLDYQPIVELHTGALSGFEALIRWSSNGDRAVSRPHYIPLAEEIGLIGPIGRWVLDEAARQLAEWQRRFPLAPPVTMNVNVSRRQLTEPDFVESVQSALTRHEVEPNTLKLEITESVIMDHLDELTPVLQQLRKAGVLLCLDDFGTGHSSLSCLHLFPTDILKIDRSFLLNMDENRSLAAVTHAIVTLAHNLGMNVVAEGVENPGQLAQLQALECDYAQGYYFAKGLTATSAAAFIEDHGRLGEVG